MNIFLSLDNVRYSYEKLRVIIYLINQCFFLLFNINIEGILCSVTKSFTFNATLEATPIIPKNHIKKCSRTHQHHLEPHHPQKNQCTSNQVHKTATN